MLRLVRLVQSVCLATSLTAIALAATTSFSIVLADPGGPGSVNNCPAGVGCAVYTEENGCNGSTCADGGADCSGCICSETQACACKSA